MNVGNKMMEINYIEKLKIGSKIMVNGVKYYIIDIHNIPNETRNYWGLRVKKTNKHGFPYITMDLNISLKYLRKLKLNKIESKLKLDKIKW